MNLRGNDLKSALKTSRVREGMVIVESKLWASDSSLRDKRFFFLALTKNGNPKTLFGCSPLTALTVDSYIDAIFCIHSCVCDKIMLK